MGLPSKTIEQRAVNTRPKTEKHKLIVMVKSTHEEYLSQPLQTNIEKFKIAVPTGHKGIFNNINKYKTFWFTT